MRPSDALPGLTGSTKPGGFLGRSIQLDSSRLKFATHAGFVTLLIGWLALALFFAPYWAAQTNFPGHHHPNGVPPHTHTVQAVLGHALLVAAVVAIYVALHMVGSLLLAPASWLERTTPKKAHGSRAPPLPF